MPAEDLIRSQLQIVLLQDRLWGPDTEFLHGHEIKELNNKHLLDGTESNIQFSTSGQGNIGRSKAEPNIILYGRNQLDVGRGQVQ